jgi:hypothetical protein
MNQTRISERKSELRLSRQDYCMASPENSDPVLGYLLTIIEWETSLDIDRTSILHSTFSSQISELQCRLKLELKLSKCRTEGVETHHSSIAKHMAELRKLKQVFAYCLVLAKRKSELYMQVEKFEQYVPQSTNTTDELEGCLNEPVVFEAIFSSYLRIYNVNILTADLIQYLYSEHQ